MKKFLALTLVLFLSLFIVGESEAYPSHTDIFQNGEVISSQHGTWRGGDKIDLLVKYDGELFWCRVSEKPSDPARLSEYKFYGYCSAVNTAIK